MVLTILWYIYFGIYWETLGRSLDQEGVYVTSRSGALRKLINWGHLLASDLDFLMLKHLYLIMMRYDRWHDVLLFDVDRCYWLSFIECVGFWTLMMQRHRWNPLDSGLSRGVCFWVDMFIMIFILIDDLMLTFLTWLLVMQADDSLSTWLTYGVKGPHTIAERLRERGGQHPCHRLLALPPWLEL